MAKIPELDASHAARLKIIAQALGLPIEAFFADPAPGEIGETITLLRLWSAISDSQGRHRVLDLIRRETER